MHPSGLWLPSVCPAAATDLSGSGEGIAKGPAVTHSVWWQLKNSWPPSPNQHLTRTVLAAGGLPCVIQQLRLMLVSIAKLTVKPASDSSPESRRCHLAECEQAWSSTSAWLAVAWSLVVCDTSHRDQCTKAELVLPRLGCAAVTE